MAKSKEVAVIEGEAVVVDEGRLKAQASLANALKRRPGLEGDLADCIAHVGLPDESVQDGDAIVEGA